MLSGYRSVVFAIHVRMGNVAMAKSADIHDSFWISILQHAGGAV